MKLPCTAIVLVHQNTPVLWQNLASLDIFQQVRVIDSDSRIEPSAFHEAGVKDIISILSPIEDFASVRNQAMHQCETPWVFFLDSDEVLDSLTPAELAAVNTLLETPEINGLAVKRSDVFLARKLQYGEAGNQQLVRFMRPDQAKWQGKAHEAPVISGTVRSTEVTLSHYSHESINSFIEDVSRYAKIVASEKLLSQTSNLVQLICYPPLKLLYDLLLLGAILDGWRGVVYSYCMALHSLLVRIYWYEKHASLVSQTNTTASN